MRHVRRVSIGALALLGAGGLVRIAWLIGGRGALVVAGALLVAWAVGKAGEDLGYWR